MIYVHKYSKPSAGSYAAQFTISMLKGYLTSGPTLLVISGGSAAKDVLPKLARELESFKNIENLTVVLGDERYGKPDHKDSNMTLLREIGILHELKRRKINIELPLNSTKIDLKGKAQDYNETIKKLLKVCQNRSIGLFGIGPDGHTAGIKPKLNIPLENIVMGYKADDFVRITLTPNALKQIKTTIIYVVGPDKKTVLEKLISGPLQSIFDFPAMVWKSHQNCHLFTDQNID